MKNTAIQELIEFMSREDVRYVDQCVNKAKQLLEKERQQIIDAVKFGRDVDFDRYINPPEQYYTETFN